MSLKSQAAPGGGIGYTFAQLLAYNGPIVSNEAPPSTKPTDGFFASSGTKVTLQRTGTKLTLAKIDPAYAMSRDGKIEQMITFHQKDGYGYTIDNIVVFHITPFENDSGLYDFTVEIVSAKATLLMDGGKVSGSFGAYEWSPTAIVWLRKTIMTLELKIVSDDLSKWMMLKRHREALAGGPVVTERYFRAIMRVMGADI